MTNDSDPEPLRAAVVLAGGHSRRFGSADKALAAIDGEPMLVRVVSRVSTIVDQVVLSCRQSQRETFEALLADAGLEITVVTDPEPDGGPLLGLCEAISHVKAPYIAVVACDMPGVDPDFLAELFAVAAGRDGAIPLDANGTPQPTQAVYRTAAVRENCSAQLAAGNRGLRELLESLQVRTLPPEAVEATTDWRSFTNVNTPAELDEFVAAERRE